MSRRHHTRSLLITTILLFASAGIAMASQVGAPEASEAYGYFRTVEGSSLLSSREAETAQDLEVNLPILTGDAVQVGRDARVEAVLADGSVARLEAGTELVFDQLARSPDAPEAGSTRLALLAGELQIRVPDETAAATPIEVESANARVYLIRGGSYWLAVSGADGTRLIVREGTAEVLTEEGSRLVQAGEEVEVSDRYGVEARVARAGYQRDIERWADDLERQAYVADYGPVEKDLRYQAAPLARSGSWVRVDGRVAWRPRVRHDWRPFTEGRWVYTPSGLTWVSSTRWGYVTSHYGSWDYLPSFGWCWFPGRVYSPAWVYWYWGPTHTAWVPYGYYARHYGPRYGWRGASGHGYGLRFGVYGYASGAWSYFADWTFCPLGYFGRRGGRHHYRSGRDLAYGRHGGAVPRGIITTDTRGIDRAVWTRPYEVRRRLGETHRGTLAVERHGLRGGELQDVTQFVARRGELPTNLQAVVKPRVEREARPVLRRIDTDTVPTKPVLSAEAPRVGTRSTGLSSATKPDVRSSDRGLAMSGRALRPGENGGESERTATRFDRQTIGRPSAFERAPTTVYRSSGSDPVRIGGARTPVTRPDTSRIPSTRSPVVRPEVIERQPTRLPERPTGFERAPTSVYSRPVTKPSTEIDGRELPTRPVVREPIRSENRTPTRLDGERPVVERRPLSGQEVRPRAPLPYPSSRERAEAPTQDRRSLYVRPAAPSENGSRRAPVYIAPSRDRIETPTSDRRTVYVRPGGSSTSGARVQSAPSGSSSSRVQSTPSRYPSSTVQSTPSRSTSSRVQSTPSRSSSSRVQSTPSRSTSSRVQSTPSSSSRSRVQSSSSSQAAAKTRAAAGKGDD